jgi:hypothetical protein
MAQNRIDMQKNPLLMPNPGFYKLKTEIQRELEEKRKLKDVG